MIFCIVANDGKCHSKCLCWVVKFDTRYKLFSFFKENLIKKNNDVNCEDTSRHAPAGNSLIIGIFMSLLISCVPLYVLFGAGELKPVFVLLIIMRSSKQVRWKMYFDLQLLLVCIPKIIWTVSGHKHKQLVVQMVSTAAPFHLLRCVGPLDQDWAASWKQKCLVFGATTPASGNVQNFGFLSDSFVCVYNI